MSDDFEYSLVDEFEMEGRQCKWMSYSEMDNDSEIMEKNDEIVAFVKTMCK